MSYQMFIDLSPEQQQLLTGGNGNNTGEEKPKLKAKTTGTIYIDPTITIPIAIGPIKIPEIAAETEITLPNNPFTQS